MRISVDVSSGDQADRANLIDDLESMGWTCGTEDLDATALEFENDEWDLLSDEMTDEINFTIRQYFDDVSFKDLGEF